MSPLRNVTCHRSSWFRSDWKAQKIVLLAPGPGEIELVLYCTWETVGHRPCSLSPYSHLTRTRRAHSIRRQKAMFLSSDEQARICSVRLGGRGTDMYRYKGPRTLILERPTEE
jgi:hypothetical protein